MDINTLRIIVTMASFVTFIAILAWAYSKGARKGFEEAAQLPFLDDTARLPVDAGERARHGANRGRS